MAAKRQVVIFKIGGEEFAADIMDTKEVLVMRGITPVPETDSYVEGVMNLRGNLVPVLDLRKRLGASGSCDSPDRRIIVANLDGRLVGLIVDGASEVIRVGEEMIEPVPDMIVEMGVGYITGIINLQERFITLIDLRKALTEEITGDLDEVTRLLSMRDGAATRARAIL
ncbi:MAG: chemotaxis protein CheW [Blastocatellia bacterium]